MSAIALYARRTAGHDDRVAAALDRLRAAAAAHPGTIVQATSLGAEDMVVTDLIARHGLPVAVATLDTGRLHAQTLALIDRTRARYGLRIEVYTPDGGAARRFEHEHGPEPMYDSVALRKACCALRKLEPLARMLAGRTAWVTGLRREHSASRDAVPFDDRDDAGRLKLNAIADWSWADVWEYVRAHGVPHNPLHDAFMPSIGCAPCTRAISVGEDFRAGRWWWEVDRVKECGLHPAATSPAPSPADAPPAAASA